MDFSFMLQNDLLWTNYGLVVYVADL